MKLNICYEADEKSTAVRKEYILDLKRPFPPQIEEICVLFEIPKAVDISHRFTLQLHDKLSGFYINPEEFSLLKVQQNQIFGGKHVRGMPLPILKTKKKK